MKKYLVILVLFLLPSFTGATYSASGIIGQTDGSGNPIYTKSVSNNSPQPFNFNAPLGIAIDATNHRMFVSDSGNNRILVYTLDTSNNFSAHNASYVLGQADMYSSSAAGTPTASSLNSPQGISYDSTDQLLFVADKGNNRILAFNVNPSTIQSAGESATYVIGQTGFTTKTTNTTSTTLSAPIDVAYDSNDALIFVADGTNNRVLAFPISGLSSTGTTASYVIGQADFTHATSAVSQSGMKRPMGLAYDGVDGIVFVYDKDNARVMAYKTSSLSNHGQNAVYVIGQTTYSGATGGGDSTHVLAATGLGFYGLSYDPDDHYLFVMDSKTNGRIVAFPVANSQSNGVSLSATLGVLLDNNINNVSLNFAGLTYDSTSKTLFAVNSPSVIVNYQITPQILSGSTKALNVLGQTSFSANAGGTASNKLSLSSGSFSGFTNVQGYNFVVDSANNRVLVYDDGIIKDGQQPLYVLGQPDFNTTTSGTSQSKMNGPTGVSIQALSFDGGATNNYYLFVSDSGNNRVLVYSIGINPIAISNGMAAYRVLGQSGFNTGTAGSVSATSLNNPKGISMEGVSGYIMIADSGNNRILLYDVSGGITNGMAALHVLGQVDMTHNSSGAASATSLNNPTDVTSGGTFPYTFVSDTGNNRVLIYDTTTITDDMPAINVVGQANLNSSTPTTTSSGLNNPKGIIVGGVYGVQDILYVADSGNNRVIAFDVTTPSNGSSDLYLFGQSSPTNASANAGGSTNQTSFSSPSGVGINGEAGYLYVVDSGNNRVIDFFLQPQSSFDSELPQSYFNFDENGNYSFRYGISGVRSSGLSGSTATALDSVHHRLFVSDTSNNRVLVFNLDSSNNISSTTASYVLGQSNMYSNLINITGNTNAKQNSLNTPKGLAYDSTNDRLFVSDATNNRVLVFDVSSGNITNGENASGVIGQADYVSNGFGSTQSTLNSPSGLALDVSGQRLFVVDKGGTNHRVLVFNVSPGFTNGLSASFHVGDSILSSPNGIAYDSVGKRIFVASGGNVVVLNADSSTIANGESALNTLTSGISVPNGYSPLSNVFGVAYNSATGYVYLSDQYSRVFYMKGSTGSISNSELPTGIIGQTTLFGTTASTSQNGLSGTSIGLTVDSTNNLVFVADNANNRVLQFTIPPPLVTNTATSTTGGGNWSSTSTWVGGVVPGDHYAVTIQGPVVIDQDIGTVGGGGIGNITLTGSAASLSVDSSASRTILFGSTGNNAYASGNANNPGSDGDMFGFVVAQGQLLLVGTQAHPVTLNSANGTGKIFIANVNNASAGSDIRIKYADMYNLGDSGTVAYDGIKWGTSFEGSSNFIDIENSRFTSPYIVVDSHMASGNITFSSNYITGRSGTYTIYSNDNKPLSQTITDNTEASPAASGTFFGGALGKGNTNCSRNALSGTTSAYIAGCVTGGVGATGGVTTGNTVNNNLVYNYPNTIGASSGIGYDDKNVLGCGGLTDNGDDTTSVCSGNISENQFHAIEYGGGSISNNYIITQPNGSQGMLFYAGVGKTNINHNIFKYISSTAVANQVLFNYNGGHDQTFDHNTVIGLSTAGPDVASTGIEFGEASFPTLLNIARNNLIGNAMSGIMDGVSGNTYASDFNAGGVMVGIHHNDVYSYGNVPYTTYAGFTTNQLSGNSHFDDGVNKHPNTVYGDISANPQYADATRESITQYDSAVLGGPGTAADFFTKLSYRSGWGGTNTLGSNPIDDARVWLFNGYKPTNVALAATASDGTTAIGAVDYNASSLATTFTFTGPTSGNVNSAAVYTVTPNASYTGTITITPTGAGSTGLVAQTVTFSGTSTGQTISFTPTVTGSITFTVTNNGGLTPSTPTITYTSNAIVNVPGAPTIGTATAGNAQATVTFTAPGSNGGATIDSYTVTSSPSSITATGSSSPITVTGLTNGTPYTFTVTAHNSAGNSSPSSASNSVTPSAPDTTPPTVSITAPSNSSTVTGSSVTISATASDNVGVVGVQFKVDGTNTGAEDTSAPYSITWDSTGVADGSHSITAVARDAAANSTTSSSVTVTVDNTAPVRSAGAPTGTQTVGTTSVNLTLTTDENATCKYSTSSGVVYASMTNTFSTTGTTSHSNTISGLSNGNSYNYYVRCVDGAGNANASDYAISFSVASAFSNAPSGGGGGSLFSGGGGSSNPPPVSNPPVTTPAPTTTPPTTPPNTSAGSNPPGSSVPYEPIQTPTITYDLGTKVLKVGVKSNGVKELQKFLNNLLDEKNVVDGILGPKTLAFIKKFQKDNKLVVDGIVGPKTKAKINSLNLKKGATLLKVK